MIKVSKSRCCGCSACAQICPKNAITMMPDADGFVYPVIDQSKCVECGLCEKVCAFQKHDTPASQKETYVAVSDDSDLKQSASGGMFASIAQAVISGGGAVYGAAMVYEDSQLWVRHICVTNLEDLVQLKGSKYVQSDMGNTYSDIRSRLNAGQTVLFSGTPCQVAGLKGYLSKDYENLFTVDLICHGVPSGKFFRDYIAYEEKKRNAKITCFRFRDKSTGWTHRGSMTFDDRDTILFEPEESSYYQMFLRCLTFRENCYHCPYASDHRPGDVSIGDFWGIESVHPELLAENGGPLDRTWGVSCLFANNDKGRALLEHYGEGIRRWKSTYADAAKHNPQLSAPSVLNPEREKVLKLYRQGYQSVDRWYHWRLLPAIKARQAIRRAVPESVKKPIKKVLGR